MQQPTWWLFHESTHALRSSEAQAEEGFIGHNGQIIHYGSHCYTIHGYVRALRPKDLTQRRIKLVQATNNTEPVASEHKKLQVATTLLQRPTQFPIAIACGSYGCLPSSMQRRGTRQAPGGQAEAHLRSSGFIVLSLQNF